MSRLLLIFTAFLIIYGCGNPSEEQAPEARADTSIVYGNTEHSFPVLSTPSREQVVRWGVLEDFLSEAKNINGSNYQDLRNHSARLTQYADSLVKNVPEVLDTRPINSRLIVLKTRAHLLSQASHQSMVDTMALQHAVSEMNRAVDNLIIHLNEKFKKEKIDLERQENREMELKKQQRTTDSIMELELQDINGKNS